MIFHVTVLRALASVLITNSHYVGVYPIDLIASGGLLGDVIFFAVSGYVLVNIRFTFFEWYTNRLSRIYPAIWIITALYLLFGLYNFSDFTIIEYFLYPTYYHFIASIIILYIPYYFIIKNKKLFDNIPKIMLGTFIIQLIIYMFIYDKSYYHIDTVREPMIRFLFFESMLLGAYFRKNKEKYINKNNMFAWVLLLLLLFVYFFTKLLFVKFSELSQFQLINQIVLFVLLFFIFKCFAGIDKNLEILPNIFKKPIEFIAKITLEIYAVQYAIIPRLSFIVFPFNWIVITFTILLTAFILHVISSKVSKFLSEIIEKYNYMYKHAK